LTLDEEVQLRCATFVQTEIERFTEEVAALSEATDESNDERTSADEDVAPKKGAARWGKKTTNGTKETEAAAPAGTLVLSFRAWA
jgi:cohesin complex subunit SA-1/2